MENENKKIEEKKETTKVESPYSTDNSAVGDTIPSPTPLNKKEVDVNDLVKLNDNLTKKLEEVEKKLNKLTEKKEVKKEEKKETYIPSITKTEEKKERPKNIVKGIYVG